MFPKDFGISVDIIYLMLATAAVIAVYEFSIWFVSNVGWS